MIKDAKKIVLTEKLQPSNGITFADLIQRGRRLGEVYSIVLFREGVEVVKKSDYRVWTDLGIELRREESSVSDIQ